MTVKVAGCWEQGWTTPIMEYDLWKFPLQDFKVDEFIMTPVSGISKKITEYKDIQEVIDNNPDLVPVFVDENGTTDLEDFEHPENALYICGRVSYSPMKLFKDTLSVKVVTPAEGGRLWPHQAISIVLYNRFKK